MDKQIKQEKLRTITRFVYDYINALNKANDIIDTPQEVFKQVKHYIRRRIKSDKDIHSLYRSAIHHRSYNAYLLALQS